MLQIGINNNQISLSCRRNTNIFVFNEIDEKTSLTTTKVSISEISQTEVFMLKQRKLQKIYCYKTIYLSCLYEQVLRYI